MNKIVFNVRNNKIHCNLSYQNKSKTLFSRHSIELLRELERQLSRDDYNIRVHKDAVVLNFDDEIIQFNNYWDIKNIIAEYIPTIADDIDYEISIQTRKKVINIRKSTLKASLFAATLALGIMSNSFNIVDNISILDDKGPIPYEYGTEPIEMPLINNYYNLYVNQSTVESVPKEGTINLSEEAPIDITEIDDTANTDEADQIYNIDIDCPERSNDTGIVSIQNNYREYAERIVSKW